VAARAHHRGVSRSGVASTNASIIDGGGVTSDIIVTLSVTSSRRSVGGVLAGVKTTSASRDRRGENNVGGYHQWAWR